MVSKWHYTYYIIGNLYIYFCTVNQLFCFIVQFLWVLIETLFVLYIIICKSLRVYYLDTCNAVYHASLIKKVIAIGINNYLIRYTHAAVADSKISVISSLA
jgi:hypothetical protein